MDFHKLLVTILLVVLLLIVSLLIGVCNMAKINLGTSWNGSDSGGGTPIWNPEPPTYPQVNPFLPTNDIARFPTQVENLEELRPSLQPISSSVSPRQQVAPQQQISPRQQTDFNQAPQIVRPPAGAWMPTMNPVIAQWFAPLMRLWMLGNQASMWSPDWGSQQNQSWNGQQANQNQNLGW
jgi:hypothetical protein